jgi:hypothetical protein
LGDAWAESLRAEKFKKRIFADMGAIWEKTSRYVRRIPTIQLQNGDFKGFFGNTLSLSPNG